RPPRRQRPQQQAGHAVRRAGHRGTAPGLPRDRGQGGAGDLLHHRPVAGLPGHAVHRGAARQPRGRVHAVLGEPVRARPLQHARGTAVGVLYVPVPGARLVPRLGLLPGDGGRAGPAHPAVARLGTDCGPGLGRRRRQPGAADRGARARLPVRDLRGPVRLPGARPGLHPQAGARCPGFPGCFRFPGGLGLRPMDDTQWRTHRLELDDQTLREWDATVLAAGAEGIVLDTSAFYPGGGGQPPDAGVLLWGGVQTRIAGARKGDDLYLIPAEGDPLPPVGTPVRGALDDARRTALMPTHSSLHVLCGVVFRDYGALVTGGNMEPLTARMDFNLPEVPPGFREAVEAACNTEVSADRRIDVRVLPRDEAFALPDIIRT